MVSVDVEPHVSFCNERNDDHIAYCAQCTARHALSHKSTRVDWEGLKTVRHYDLVACRIQDSTLATGLQPSGDDSQPAATNVHLPYLFYHYYYYYHSGSCASSNFQYR